MHRLLRNLAGVAVSGHLGTALIAAAIPCVLLVAGGIDWGVVAMSAIALIAGSMAGFLANDLHDITRDTLNKPHRPLVGGSLDIAFAKTAMKVLLFAFLTSAVLLLFVTAWALLLVAYTAFYLVYNWVNDHAVLAKNVFVALGFVAPLAYAAALLGTLDDNALFLLAGYLAFVARELLMDVNDAEGDLIAGYRTIPNRIGEKRAKVIVGLLWAAAFALLIVQWRALSQGPIRLTVFFVAAAMLFALYARWLKGGLSVAGMRVLVISTWAPMCMFAVLMEM